MLPTIAITFRTLSAFRQMHRTCPRFSRQAFIRSLCHLHGLAYESYMVDRFTVAYDVYLEILYRVQDRCAGVLGRNDKFWRMKNACAPCTYELEGEPPLRFKMIVSIDGNSSLKLVGDEVRSGRFLPDDRTARTDMWVSREDVDSFKDGVSICMQFHIQFKYIDLLRDTRDSQKSLQRRSSQSTRMLRHQSYRLRKQRTSQQKPTSTKMQRHQPYRFRTSQHEPTSTRIQRHQQYRPPSALFMLNS